MIASIGTFEEPELPKNLEQLEQPVSANGFHSLFIYFFSTMSLYFFKFSIFPIAFF